MSNVLPYGIVIPVTTEKRATFVSANDATDCTRYHMASSNVQNRLSWIMNNLLISKLLSNIGFWFKEAKCDSFKNNGRHIKRHSTIWRLKNY